MAGRDGEEPKEGVDFKWVKGEGTNAKVRKFFSAAEKAEMGKLKAPAKAPAPKATPKTPAQKGRGDGMVETYRRQVESNLGTGPKLVRSGPAKPESITSPTSRGREDGPKRPTKTAAAKPATKTPEAPKPAKPAAVLPTRTPSKILEEMGDIFMGGAKKRWRQEEIRRQRKLGKANKGK
jgi:hypothetical protein